MSKDDRLLILAIIVGMLVIVACLTVNDLIALTWGKLP